MMIGDPQGEELGLITPCTSTNCFFTPFASKTTCLYSPIFDNGETSNNHITCYTSLLGGTPLGSWNTPLYACNNSTNSCFLSLVHPTKDAFTLINLSLYWFSHKKSKTYLNWANEIFGLVGTYQWDLWFTFKWIDHEWRPILDEEVLVFSAHEDCTLQIHLGSSIHYTTHVKGNYI